MPITRKIQTNSGEIFEWTIDESTEGLECLCNERRLPLPPPQHLEARRQQMMVTSLLHAEMFPGTVLTYEKTGKPAVNNESEISISHSGNILVMMKSDFPCGVDIERIHPRIRKVRKKFLSDDELQLTEHSDDITLTRFWTAKEAMFKVSGSDTVFMRSNIFVEILKNEQAIALLKDGTDELRRKIRFDIQGDLMLAWTEMYEEA